jgi:DNA-binding NtrC family response regulator
MTPAILVVDDDLAFRGLVVEIIGSQSYRLHEAGSAEEALAILSREEIDLVLTDQRMPGLSGIDLARRVRSSARAPSVIVMTAYGTIPQAVEAMQAGATDYLTKPLESPAALRQLVRRVLGERQEADAASGEFLSRDPAMLEILSLVDRAATTDATILINGESGTGKELLARRVHSRSPRQPGPFVAVNCAAIPENLAESELFGHERGAFTGADRRRPGRFEQAAGGTLFLDEVGELQEAVQAKLLRALEERCIERVGGTATVPVDLRLVAATNRDLEEQVNQGSFRADLYYRLNVINVVLPPLRERPADIVLLTPVLIESLAGRLGVGSKQANPATMALLKAYSWPGNVRELRNALERALIVATGDLIEPHDLPGLDTVQAHPAQPSREATPPPLSLEERERQAILDALQRCHGHREQAAQLLGISVRTLYNRLKQYGIR